MSKKILLVEDEALIAMSEARVLQKHGFKVDTVYNGEAAVEKVEIDPSIALVLMDIDLGRGIDGTEAAERILEQHDLPIVFLSSHTEPQIVEKTEGITSYGYILKNSGEMVLAASIKMAFRLYDAHLELKQQKEQLRASLIQQGQSEERLRITLNSIGDAVISTDTQGRIVRMNSVAEGLCGWRLENARGRSLDEVFYIVNANTRRRVHNPVAKALESGEVVGLANHTMLISKDGAEFQIADSAAPIKDDNGTISGVVLVFRDVTEEYAQRQELLSTRDELRAMLQVLPEGFVRVDAEGRIIYANETAERILGLHEDSVTGSYYSDRKFHQIDADGEPFPVEQLPLAVTLRERREVHGLVHGIVAPDGETRWLSVNTAALEDGAIASFREISEQRENANRLAASEKKYRDLAESVGAVLWEYDILSDRWTYVAPQVKDLLGYESAEWSNLKFWADRIHPEDRNWATGYCNECTLQGKNHQFEYRFAKKCGEYVWIRDDVIVETSEGKPVKLRGFMVDISNRKQAELDLKKALEEKELLMRELNHRIKNNLSMITSLIGLKEMETDNDLSDIMHQIDAIRIIHEKLYQTESISSIRVQTYFQELLETVFASFSSRPIELVILTGDIQVSTDLAVILGLIVNEIATNAIKYGFQDAAKALFRVEMSAEDTTNRYVLSLSNTGWPFPEDKSLENPGTLGLQLISTLVDQLNGEIDLQKSPHPLFTISFPM
ncbi:MAG: PAS domain S-box protein [Spirochaetia bacterium]|nr:PAS domain S-box protein [Spirochaetia bacterium]